MIAKTLLLPRVVKPSRSWKTALGARLGRARPMGNPAKAVPRRDAAARLSGFQGCAPLAEDGVDPGEVGVSVVARVEAAHNTDGPHRTPGEAEDGAAAVAGDDFPGPVDQGEMAVVVQAEEPAVVHPLDGQAADLAAVGATGADLVFF